MNVKFEHEIESVLTPDRLWQLVVEAFEDSESSPIWPGHLETLRCDQLGKQAVVEATYHVGPFDTHQSYTIAAFDPDRRTLEYLAGPDHPLTGGGTIHVSATRHGSKLRWSGAYALSFWPSELGALVFVKTWFESRFFGALESNLRGVERSQPRPRPGHTTRDTTPP